MTNCPICDSETKQAFIAEVLRKYQVIYYHCDNCGFLQTEHPYWLDEAYSEAIAKADTGLVMRNLSISRKLAVLLFFCFQHDAAYLDFAGGYGLMTRLLRDIGFDFYWDDKYCQNLMALGFEAGKAKRNFEAVTAFEFLEHINAPLTFLLDTLDLYGCRTFIFSTELYSGRKPPGKDWWYYAFEEGQHVAFYQHRTLVKLAEKLGLNFYSISGLHVFTQRKLRHINILRFVIRWFSPMLTMLIRRCVGSRTLKDHCQLIAQQPIDLSIKTNAK